MAKDDRSLLLKYFMAENFKEETINLMISYLKQSSEEESTLSIIDGENLEMKTYRTPLWPIGIVRIF